MGTRPSVVGRRFQPYAPKVGADGIAATPALPRVVMTTRCDEGTENSSGLILAGGVTFLVGAGAFVGAEGA